MKKLIFLILAMSMPMFAQTTTFHNLPSSGNCKPVDQQDGQSIPTGYYVCFQATSFNTSPGFSLYLPSDESGYSLILEDCGITYSSKVLTSGNGGAGSTYSQTDTVPVCHEWSGTVVENLVRSSVRTCTRYGCKTYFVDTVTDGSGQFSKVQ